MPLLARTSSLLLVIDMQERLLPAIHDAEAVTDRTLALVAGAGTLGVPVLASEQYPKGLGRTVPPLAGRIGEDARVEKTCFSAGGAPEIAAALARLDPAGVVVLAGVEAHVCVLQTALDLAGSGRRVALAADAAGSRRPEDRALALARARAHGIDVVTTEMVLFEWLGRAGTAEFRVLQPLLRALGEEGGAVARLLATAADGPGAP
jgi:nicotinamidase-related amidase